MASKFEKLIEYIINDDQAKAKALFHKIVVEKSRDIYESLQEDDLGGEDMGATDFEDDVADHEASIDGDEEGFGGDEMGAEGGDELGGDELGGEADMETRVMDLEDAIDELKAEFDSLVGGEGGDELGGDDFGGEEVGGEEDFGGDDLDSDEGSDDLGSDEGSEEDEPASPFGESKKVRGKITEGMNQYFVITDPSLIDKISELDGTEVDIDDDGQGGTVMCNNPNITAKLKAFAQKNPTRLSMMQVRYDNRPFPTGDHSVNLESRKSPQELMREYVEKVGQNWPNGASEGDAIGAAGQKSPINSKSPVISGKNDMGGTTANIAKGGTASDKDSNTGPKKPSNEYSKGSKEVEGASSWENRPGANTKGYKNKQGSQTQQGKEVAAGGSASVNDKSIEPGGKPGFKG